jgi:hypothetical protein
MKKSNWRFQSTINFIHICYERKPQRQKTLAKKLHFEHARLQPFEQDITKIMDFIKEIDIQIHDNEGDEPFTALGQTFHSNLSSDLCALIILAITKQNFQMNIILRHFIEFFIVSLWIEIGSRFTGGFNYYLYSEKWKKYRRDHKFNWNQIQGRLNDIIILNGIKGKNPLSKYFQTANEYDFRFLLSLPIRKCGKGNRERNYKRFKQIRRRTQKIERKAVYKMVLSNACLICKKRKTINGYVMGIPKTEDMVRMLKQITAVSDPKFGLNIELLREVYNYLSAEFVHFATRALPDRPPPTNTIGKQQVVMWGLDGVIFRLKILNPLTN